MSVLSLLAVVAVSQETPKWQSYFCTDTVLVDEPTAGDYGRAPLLKVGTKRNLLVDFPEVRTAYGPAGGAPARIVYPLFENDGLTLKAAYIVTKPFKQDQATWKEASPTIRWERGGALGENDTRLLPGVTIAATTDSLVIEGLEAAVGALTDPTRPSYGLLFEFTGTATLASADHPLEPMPTLFVDTTTGNDRAKPPFVARLVTGSGVTRQWEVSWPQATSTTRLRVLNGNDLVQEVAFSASNKTAGFDQGFADLDDAEWRLQIVGDGGAGEPPSAPFYPNAISMDNLPAVSSLVQYLNRVVMPLQRTALHPFGMTARVAPSSSSPSNVDSEGGRTAIAMLAAELKSNYSRIPIDLRSDALFPTAFAQPAPGWWWPDDGLMRVPRVNVVPQAWLVDLETALLDATGNFDPRQGPTTLLIDLRDANNVTLKNTEVVLMASDGSVLGQGKTSARSGLVGITSSKGPVFAQSDSVSLQVKRGTDFDLVTLSKPWLQYQTAIAGRPAVPIEVRAMVSDAPVNWTINVLPTAAADLTEKTTEMFIGVPFNPPAWAAGYESLLPSNQQPMKVVEWTFDLGRDRRIGGLTAANPAPLMRLEVLTKRTGEQGEPRRWFRDANPSQHKKWATESSSTRFLTIRALMTEGTSLGDIGFQLHPTQ
ncbi:MAG: hypothetical protein KF812_01715 [Fimbriimonadaceae bacterium]|nr:hypothetical protein [Fimbriimonadaceae bacterium]